MVRIAMSIAVLALGIGIAAAPDDVSPSPCNWNDWGEPTRIATLIANGSGATAHAHPGADGLSIAHSNAVDPADRRPGEYAELAVRTPAGEWVSLQAEGAVFAYPRIAVERTGVLHVLWAEPAASGSTRYQTIWHASLRDQSWSAPERVYSGRDIRWYPTAMSNLIVDETGTLHLAFTGDAIGGQWTIVYGRASSEKWSFVEIPTSRPAVYADLARHSDGRLAIVYAAADETEPVAITNTLFMIESLDAGASWSAATRVSEPVQSPAFEPRIMIDKVEVHHVVWSAEGRQQPGTQLLLHALSRDGEPWRATSPLQVPGALLNGLSTVMDSCGTIHALFTTGDEHVNVGYARLPAGSTAWSLERPFAGVAQGIAIDLSGRLHVLWLTEHSPINAAGSVPGALMHVSREPLKSRPD